MLFTVADLKSLLIKVNLNEVDIAKVSVGQPVRVTLDAYPQKTSRAGCASWRRRRKRGGEDQGLRGGGRPRPARRAFRTGMSANVEILGEKRANALSVPLEALQRRDGQTVATAEGRT